MREMDRLLVWARKIARVGAWFGGVLLVAAAFLISYDVFIRTVFTTSVGGADELSGYALAIGSAWAYSFTLLDRAHVRIDSLYVTLPTRVCAVLDIVGLTIFVAFMCVLGSYALNMFADTVRYDAHSLSPIAVRQIYPQSLWVAGLVLFMLTSLLLLTRAFLALITGDIATVQRLVGSRSITQEIEQEVGTRTSGSAAREETER